MGIIPGLLGPARPFPGIPAFPGKRRLEALEEAAEGKQTAHPCKAAPPAPASSQQTRASRERTAGGVGAAAAAAPGGRPTSPPSTARIPAGGGRCLLGAGPEARWRPLVAKRETELDHDRLEGAGGAHSCSPHLLLTLLLLPLKPGFRSSAPPLNCCVTLGKSLNLPVPQFPSCKIWGRTLHPPVPGFFHQQNGAVG